MKTLVIRGYAFYDDFYANHLREIGTDCRSVWLLRHSSAKFLNKWQVAMTELRMLLLLLRKMPQMRGRIVYSSSAHYALMLIYRLLGWTLGGSRLVLDNFYIHQMGENKWVQRVLRFLISNRRLTIVLQTPGEIEYFSALSSIPKLQFVPYCMGGTPTLNGGGSMARSSREDIPTAITA